MAVGGGRDYGLEHDHGATTIAQPPQSNRLNEAGRNECVYVTSGILKSMLPIPPRIRPGPTSQ
jgi:hypothetical protein